MFETWAKLHAALNDLPAALLAAAVLFELAGWLLKRETVRAAAVWMLWAGVVGGWAAFIAGNQAEGSIDHDDLIHDIMERHESLALYTMIAFTAILAVHLWRRGALRPIEAWAARGLGVAGLVLLFLTGRAGGQAVFDHGAGIRNADLLKAITDRGLDTAFVKGPQTDSAPRKPSHEHAPGTPAHDH
jgi:uncharacterized membrane protein